MRVLFAGSPALAVPALERTAAMTEVAAVLTCCDQPVGRGGRIEASPVKTKALELGIPVLQPDRLDPAALEQVRALAPDLLVVAAFGMIFRPEFLSLFPMGGINVHPSLLPRHRGPSPISAAILEGDAETGVTIQNIAQRFDTGDILAQRAVPLRGDETTGSLTAALADVGADLLAGVLASVTPGEKPRGRAQDEALATYCRMVRKEDGLVDWTESAAVIERKVRAYDPWPRAATSWKGASLLLLKTGVYAGTLPEAAEAPADVPGTVGGADRQRGILVRTGGGILCVERLQEQFRKPMDWRSFLNGHPDFVGARLGG